MAIRCNAAHIESFPIVADLQGNLVWFAEQSHTHSGSSGVLCHIIQSFLGNAVERDLDINWEWIVPFNGYGDWYAGSAADRFG
jgi:hypothetical protein